MTGHTSKPRKRREEPRNIAVPSQLDVMAECPGDWRCDLCEKVIGPFAELVKHLTTEHKDAAANDILPATFLGDEELLDRMLREKGL